MAKAFNFSLQKVLDVRKSVEDLKSVELSKAKTNLLSQKSKLDNLKANKNATLQKAKADHGISGTLNINKLRITNEYVSQLNEKINGQAQQVFKSEKDVSKKHEHLLSAARDKKAVEILKDKYLQTYRKMIAKDETKKDSELALRMKRQNDEDNNV